MPIVVLWGLVVFVANEPPWPTRLLLAAVASPLYAFVLWIRSQPD